MTTNKPDLRPRAIAVLVALSNGPRTTRQLRDAVGDGRKSDPTGLLASMRSRPLSLVTQRPHDDRWYLTHDGLGWLQGRGLDAVPESRAWHHEEMMKGRSVGAMFYQLAHEIRNEP